MSAVLLRKFSQQSLFHAVVYFWLFAVPILYNRALFQETISNSANISLIMIIEMVDVLVVLSFLFFICSINKVLYGFMLGLFFALGAASNYFLFNFSRTLNVMAVQEIFENEASLVQEYIQFPLIITIITSIALFILIRNKTFNKICGSWFACALLVCFGITAVYDAHKNSMFIFRSVMQAYMPMNAFYSTGYYLINNHLFLKKHQSKFDIAKEHYYTFGGGTREPLVVVMVVGESLRGDMIGINTPMLSSLDNLISFSKACSYTNLTREAVPLMLTRAVGGDIKSASKETSIISVFRRLGFVTAWIGNQGIFSNNNDDFGDIALEAESVISRSTLRTLTSSSRTYDGMMLPFIKNHLQKNASKNIFLVVHMIGSHWKFDERYPVEFKKFTPTCDSSPAVCSKDELRNGYNNTVLYTDAVLHEIISELKDQNAFLLYASDHGLSLMENGKFGNANTPKPQEELDIAMFFWGSGKYIKHNKSSFNNIAASRNSEVSHDNIFHTLLGCSNIESDILVPSLNLCGSVGKK